MERGGFFQANLSRLISERGWSLKQLAKESGASYHTCFRAVSLGILPRGGNQKKLADALGVSISDLHSDPEKLAASSSRGSVDIFSPEIRQLILSWKGAKEEWQRHFALFVLTGKYEHLMKVSPEVRKRLEKALRLFGLSPPSQPSKK